VLGFKRVSRETGRLGLTGSPGRLEKYMPLEESQLTAAGLSPAAAKLIVEAINDHTHWSNEIAMSEEAGEVETLEEWAGEVDAALDDGEESGDSSEPDED